jgi:hypothetical protein
VAHPFRLNDSRGKAETLEHEDYTVSEVEFPSAYPDRSRGGVVMMGDSHFAEFLQIFFDEDNTFPGRLIRCDPMERKGDDMSHPWRVLFGNGTEATAASAEPVTASPFGGSPRAAGDGGALPKARSSKCPVARSPPPAVSTRHPPPRVGRGYLARALLTGGGFRTTARRPPRALTEPSVA